MRNVVVDVYLDGVRVEDAVDAVAPERHGPGVPLPEVYLPAGLPDVGLVAGGEGGVRWHRVVARPQYGDHAVANPEHQRVVGREEDAVARPAAVAVAVPDRPQFSHVVEHRFGRAEDLRARTIRAVAKPLVVAGFRIHIKAVAGGLLHGAPPRAVWVLHAVARIRVGRVAVPRVVEVGALAEHVGDGQEDALLRVRHAVPRVAPRRGPDARGVAVEEPVTVLLQSGLCGSAAGQSRRHQRDEYEAD